MKIFIERDMMRVEMMQMSFKGALSESLNFHDDKLGLQLNLNCTTKTHVEIFFVIPDKPPFSRSTDHL